MALANLNIRHAFLGDPPQPLRKVVIIVMIADGIPAELKCGSGLQQAQTQLVVFEAAGEGDIEATYLLKERGGHRHITAEKITVCEAVPGRPISRNVSSHQRCASRWCQLGRAGSTGLE